MTKAIMGGAFALSGLFAWMAMAAATSPAQRLVTIGMFVTICVVIEAALLLDKWLEGPPEQDRWQ